MEAFKSAAFEEDELKYHDMSLLIAFSPLLAKQDSISKVANYFQDFTKKIVFLL